MENNWTFATQMPSGKFVSSSRTFHHMKDALEALIEWIEVNAINGEFPAVRLVDVKHE